MILKPAGFLFFFFRCYYTKLFKGFVSKESCCRIVDMSLTVKLRANLAPL